MTDSTPLPQVVALLGRSDASEFGNANCPHCGAPCRYIYHFICADGIQRGAAKVCFGLFPKHRFVAIHESLTDRRAEHAKKGRALPDYEARVVAAIEAFARGEESEHAVETAIRVMAGIRSARRASFRTGRRH